MFCSNCGAQMSDGSAFCPNCGTNLGSGAPASQGNVANVQRPGLFLSTLASVSGKEVEELGLVKGSVVSSKNVGKDFLAGLKNLAGGELKSYTELTTGAREMALERMKAEAMALGADGVIGIRFTSSPISVEGAADVMAYGTAVKIVSLS